MSTSPRSTESAILAFLGGAGTGDDSLDAVLTAMAALPPAPDSAADLITRLAVTASESGPSVRASRSKPLPSRWRRRAAISTILSSLAGKVAIASVALATTTGGLAATDSLPAPAQQVVSDVAARIGISLPAPDDNAGANAPSAEDTDDPSELSDESSQEGRTSPDLPDEASDTAKNRLSEIHGGGKAHGPPDGKAGGGPPDGKPGGGPPDGKPGGGPPDGKPGGGPPDKIPAGPPSDRGGGTPASPGSPRP